MMCLRFRTRNGFGITGSIRRPASYIYTFFVYFSCSNCYFANRPLRSRACLSKKVLGTQTAILQCRLPGAMLKRLLACGSQ